MNDLKDKLEIEILKRYEAGKPILDEVTLRLSQQLDFEVVKWQEVQVN